MVELPGSKGRFQILKNHAPIVSTLAKGVIRIREKNNTEHEFEVDGGVIENKANKIIVLVESA